MKTYLKTLTRMFKKHIARFLSVIFMVLVSVGFIAGIFAATEKIDYSLTDYYKNQNVSDFIIKSKDGEFSDEDIAGVKALEWVKSVSTGVSVDVNLKVDGKDRLTRLYFLDFDDWTVNMFDLKEGSASTDKSEAYAEVADNKIIGYALGTEIELDFKDVLVQLAEQNGEELDALTLNILGSLEKPTIKISGTIQSPLTFAKDGEPSFTNPEDVEVPDTIDGLNSLITLENVLYISKDVIPKVPFVNTPVLSTGDMYVAIEDRDLFSGFSKNYESYIEEKTEELTAKLDNVKILTLYDNFSFNSLHSYSDKVIGIGAVLMVAFLFVTALVVLSNMTRLMDEERQQIACLRTLGYSAFRIIFKYVLFAMLATGIGGTGAYFVGLGLAFLIYYVFNYSFAMPPVTKSVAIVYFLITFFVIVAATFIATVLAGRKLTSEKPANLLRPKPPKAGKKVILEKIPLLWNRLSFKYKSTTRNVLRYKSRFIMTVLAVAVSTSLVMAGLALLDLCINGTLSSPSIMAIALVVVIFAGLLTMVVIYTLTNINVSERNRELATLMVLGYYDREVTGYVYREIYIDTVVGIIFGYPLSVLLMWLVFSVMAVGTIGGVSWYWWLAAPFVVLAFTFIVTLMLRRKIVGIDMNESLKAIE